MKDNIEEDIKKLKARFLNINWHYGRLALTENQYLDIKELIENVLADRERLKQENETLKNREKHQSKEIKKAVDYTFELNAEIEKKDKMIQEAYAKANNYLYFNDSADYEVALWEVIRSLRPDLAKKWDDGEDANLQYIEE